jgi:hypothetical protein
MFPDMFHTHRSIDGYWVNEMYVCVYIYIYKCMYIYMYVCIPAHTIYFFQYLLLCILYLPYGYATPSNHFHMFMARFFTNLSVTLLNLVDSWFSSNLELVCANCIKPASYLIKQLCSVPCALIISSDSFYWLNCLTHQNLMADSFMLCLMSCMGGMRISTTRSLHSWPSNCLIN